jgi:hypothetical protein
VSAALIELRDAMASLRDASGFQRDKISALQKESFDHLSNRPAREQLLVPLNLRGLQIFICRKDGERGGVEISVRIERRSMLIFSSVSEDGFEKLPDGRIIPFDDGQYDDKD